MPLAKNFQKNVRSTRLKKQMSQDALARAAGISVSYVSMLERGQRSPPLYTIESVANALGVTPLKLLAA